MTLNTEIRAKKAELELAMEELDAVYAHTDSAEDLVYPTLKVVRLTTKICLALVPDRQLYGE